VTQAQGHQRDRQRQTGEQVPRWKPEAEHRRRHERRHQQLSAQRGGAQRGRELDPADPRHSLGEPLAVRAPQPPQPGEGQREHRRPAQQPVLAVDEQRDQPVAALEIAAREGGLGRRFARRLGGVRRRPAVERLVERHEQRDGEQRELDRAHRQCPAPRPPESARRDQADQRARRHELRAQPRKGTEQREAQERLRAHDALAKPQREQRRPGQCRARGQLRVDGAPIGHERWAEPDTQRRAECPRVRCHTQREPVRQRHRQRRDRGEEQLDGLRAADGVGGRDQERKADPVRLVPPTLGLAAMRVQLVGVEAGVGALGVLVAHVHVAVVDDRLRRQQVVRLVAPVVGGTEGVQADGGRVDAEQQQPEGKGATHRRRTLATRAYATTAIDSW
jgi:hypothetical protein